MLTNNLQKIMAEKTEQISSSEAMCLNIKNRATSCVTLLSTILLVIFTINAGSEVILPIFEKYRYQKVIGNGFCTQNVKHDDTRWDSEF